MYSREQDEKIKRFLNGDSLINKDDIILAQCARMVDNSQNEKSNNQIIKILAYREKIDDSENLVVFHIPASNGKGKDSYTFFTPIYYEHEEAVFFDNLEKGEWSVKGGDFIPLKGISGVIFGAVNPKSNKNGQFVDVENSSKLAYPGRTFNFADRTIEENFSQESISEEEKLVIEKFIDPKVNSMLQSELGILQGIYEKEASINNAQLDKDFEIEI